jgi:hypothetical protein
MWQWKRYNTKTLNLTLATLWIISLVLLEPTSPSRE